MASVAVRRQLEDYDDMVVPPRWEADVEAVVAGEYSAKYHEHPNIVVIPVSSSSALRLDTRATHSQSMGVVLEHIKQAPIAYFRFMCGAGFLVFVFSLVFYVLFRTILFNPLLAVFGALGSLLTLLLVEVSFLVEKRKAAENRQA